MEIQTTQKIQTHIYKILERKVKDRSIIVLRTDIGPISNYASLWEKIAQDLDVKSLTSADLVEIEYYTYIGRHSEFNNFLSVKRVSAE